MKTVQVIFKDSKYNYITSVNADCDNEKIKRYFVGELFEMNDGTSRQCVEIRLQYRVISGSFTGEIGFINPFRKWSIIPLLTTKDGNHLAVSFCQLEQTK